MGVKNLWGILSCTGQVIAVGAPGEPVKGSAAAARSKRDVRGGTASVEASLTALELNDEEHSDIDSRGDGAMGALFCGHDVGTMFCGEAVAVDLSCWVCDSQANNNMHSVIKPHLRNLVFRTWSLLSVGVLPVYVLEGVAPQLKQATMQARNAQRGGAYQRHTQDGGGKQNGDSKRATRGRFNSVLKECCELLRLLGIPYVQAVGEAEATCAALLYHKVVEAVITEDSDVLLYGGHRVLRGFTVQHSRPTAELYQLSSIEHKLQLTRSSLVVLSLLLGCDYLPAGVAGVGVTHALRLVQEWGRRGVDPLSRFQSWVDHTPDLDAQLAKFKKNGDLDTLEDAVRDRAVRTVGFPFEGVVEEFLSRLQVPEDMESRLCWGPPCGEDLVTYCQTKLGWDRDYAAQKTALFCCRWLACHAPAPQYSLRDTFKARRICKSCNRGGVLGYEVEWHFRADDRRECAVPVGGGPGKDVSVGGLVVKTVEPQALLTQALPWIVAEFEDEKTAKKKGRGRKKTETSTLTKASRSSKTKKKTSAAASDDTKQLKLTCTTSSAGRSLTLVAKRAASIPDGGRLQSERSTDAEKESRNLESVSKKHFNSNVKMKFDSSENVDIVDLRDSDDSLNLCEELSDGGGHDAGEPILSRDTREKASSASGGNLPTDLDWNSFEFDCESHDVSSNSQDDVSFIVDRFINMNMERKKRPSLSLFSNFNEELHTDTFSGQGLSENKVPLCLQTKKDSSENFPVTPSAVESASVYRNGKHQMKVEAEMLSDNITSPGLSVQKCSSGTVSSTSPSQILGGSTDKYSNVFLNGRDFVHKQFSKPNLEGVVCCKEETDEVVRAAALLETVNGGAPTFQATPTPGMRYDDSYSCNIPLNKLSDSSVDLFDESFYCEDGPLLGGDELEDKHSACLKQDSAVATSIILTSEYSLLNDRVRSNSSARLTSSSPSRDSNLSSRSSVKDLRQEKNNLVNSSACSAKRATFDNISKETEKPSFELLDSRWLDSESFLCSPLSASPKCMLKTHILSRTKAITGASVLDERKPLQSTVKGASLCCSVPLQSNHQHILSVQNQFPCEIISHPILSATDIYTSAKTEMKPIHKPPTPYAKLHSSHTPKSSSQLLKSFSLSPCVEQLSLAERMKNKYGSKVIAALLPHTDN